MVADLKKGEIVPYNGVLLSLDVAAQQLLEIENCPARIEARAEFETTKAVKILEHERENRRIDRIVKDSEIDMLRKALKNKFPWYERPIPVALVTFAGTLGIVWIVGQSK